MGTRADFYVGRGLKAEWLGSIAWDGYPSGIFEDEPGCIGQEPERDWRRWVAGFLSRRKDATLPESGWPWPWEDSRTTDYAYALDDGLIWVSRFGREWFALNPADEALGEPDGNPPKTAVFPDMKLRQNVVVAGQRSGLIVLGL